VNERKNALYYLIKESRDLRKKLSLIDYFLEVLEAEDHEIHEAALICEMKEN
jgi:hypothetical protein